MDLARRRLPPKPPASAATGLREEGQSRTPLPKRASFYARSFLPPHRPQRPFRRQFRSVGPSAGPSASSSDCASRQRHGRIHPPGPGACGSPRRGIPAVTGGGSSRVQHAACGAAAVRPRAASHQRQCWQCRPRSLSLSPPASFVPPHTTPALARERLTGWWAT